MTQMTIHEDDKHVKIDIVGHAGYNPGNDVVCAAISTMSYALINSLERLMDGFMINELTVVDEPGNFHITFTKIYKFRSRWYAIRDFFMTGMEMISEEYPEYLQI